MMNTQLMPVPFDGDTVVLVGQDNQPYVAMRPVVSNMGLDWPTQYVKLTERFTSTVGEIPTVGEDGKTRSMICLPLRKLPAWLYSINPNKVALELRDKVLRYQEECDDALWDYWTKGQATRAGPRTAAQDVALSNHRLTLLKELQRARNGALRAAIHEQLAQVSTAMGLSVPLLDDIGLAEPTVSEALDQFWAAISTLEANGVPCNHAKNPALLALNLPELKQVFTEQGVGIPVDRELTLNLKASQNPRCLGYKAVDSRIRRGIVKCWTFSKRPSE